MIIRFAKITALFLLCTLLITAFSSCLNGAEDYSHNDYTPPSSSISNTQSSVKNDYNQDDKKTTRYVLNTQSKKIHKTTCGTGDLISPENRDTYTGDIEDLYDLGYTLCGNCFK